uniref:Regulator of protease activity HflC, stomatin/prohibitin superfamily n=1 Tax=Candidatus Kentrum sp. UNK TaxID=2126344 RepID=A0A451AK71_9GAMM|nr:MAG: Regulator of protease activity HflC, stomatin/prohibitin superfamily [Candidatus Kentron sp. UNK]VFK72034.1 MAG: Regulator of protease activity HflC, stomatin/prohibitin superfamily [Candidatus Kentron sp. UNK]
MNPTAISKHIAKAALSLKTAMVPLLITGLIFLLAGAYTVRNIIYFVGPGEAGIHWSLFKGGTEIDRVYGEGIRLFPPWDRFAIYNVRIQEVASELDVLTETGLQVHLSLSIRYRPQYNMLGVLHQQVGPDYVNTVVIPEIEAVLREIIGTMMAEEIYTTGRAVIIEAINQAIEQISQRFIDVDDVLIRRITLPDSVAEAIRDKIREKHQIETKEFSIKKAEKEADRKRAEAAGIRDHLDVIASAIPKDQILTWYGIKVTEEIATSNNAKVIIIGSGENGLPIILNADAQTTANPTPQAATVQDPLSSPQRALPESGAMDRGNSGALNDNAQEPATQTTMKPAGQNTQAPTIVDAPGK